jgi:hypothetical protein
MSRRSDHESLRQLLDHAIEASEMVAERARGDLNKDRMLNLALTRLVEVMGEADFCGHTGCPPSSSVGRDHWNSGSSDSWLRCREFRYSLAYSQGRFAAIDRITQKNRGSGQSIIRSKELSHNTARINSGSSHL